MSDNDANESRVEGPSDQGRVGRDAEPKAGVATEARPAPSMEAMYRASWRLWQELAKADERDGR